MRIKNLKFKINSQIVNEFAEFNSRRLQVAGFQVAELQPKTHYLLITTCHFATCNLLLCYLPPLIFHSKKISQLFHCGMSVFKLMHLFEHIGLQTLGAARIGLIRAKQFGLHIHCTHRRQSMIEL